MRSSQTGFITTSLLCQGHFLLLVNGGYNVPELDVCRDMSRLQPRSGDVSAIVLQHTTAYSCMMAQIHQSYLINTSTLNILGNYRQNMTPPCHRSCSIHVCLLQGLTWASKKSWALTLSTSDSGFAPSADASSALFLRTFCRLSSAVRMACSWSRTWVTYCFVTPVTTPCILQLHGWLVLCTSAGQRRPMRRMRLSRQPVFMMFHEG